MNESAANTTALTTGGEVGYLRIATEEAYAPIELFEQYRRVLDEGAGGLGFRSLMGHYLTSDAQRPQFIRSRLSDLGDTRLSEMDEAGVDHAVLSLTAPGTQVLRADVAEEIAAIANERVAEATRQHPSRFSGLAAVGFGNVPAAVRELDRAIGTLGLKGLICNSHIGGRYLDDPEFFPVLEALESLGAPLYLHPNAPNEEMIKPLYQSGIDGAIFGFGVETAMHLLRLITAGVFDRFPELKVVVGHLGEALPYWFYRLDYMHAAQVRSGRYEVIKPLELRPSEYFRRNIWLTTSGMPWVPTIMYAREVVGADRVMYAMDYPYEYSPEEVRMQDALPIDAPGLKQFYQDNAVRVFNLDHAKLVG